MSESCLVTGYWSEILYDINVLCLNCLRHNSIGAVRIMAHDSKTPEKFVEGICFSRIRNRIVNVFARRVRCAPKKKKRNIVNRDK